MENSATPSTGIQPDAPRFFVPVQMDRTRVLAFDSAATFLLYQRFGDNFLFELYEQEPGNAAGKLRLRSRDAFVFFLWAGLQRDAKAAGEYLSIADVEDQIVPMSISDLAAALSLALAATRRPRSSEPKNA